MNKRLIKYLLRSVIALGTVGFLNGISVKIFEETQVPLSSKNVDTTESKTESKSVIDLTDLHALSNMTDLPMPQALDIPSNLSADQKIEPKTELEALQTDGIEEDESDLENDLENNLIEPTDAQKNKLIVDKISSAGTSPKIIDCTEKHKNNYQLPRIYTTNNRQSEIKKQDVKIQDSSSSKSRSEDLCSKEKDWSEGYGDDDYKSMGGNSRHSTSSDDEMLNQFVRLMEQENRNNSSNQSYSGNSNSSPQNFGTTPNYRSTPNSTQDYNVTGDVSPVKKTTDKNDTGTTNTPAGESLSNILLPIADEKNDQEDIDDTSKSTKKLKKKNKKKELKTQEPAKKLVTKEIDKKEIDKKDQTPPPVIQKPVDEKPVEKLVDEKPTEPVKNDSPAMQIPDALKSVYEKFAQAFQEFQLAKQEGKAVDSATFVKSIDELVGTATTWITENKKNTADEKTQQALKDYKIILEQQCAGYDKIIEDIMKQEIPEAEKTPICATYTMLKNISQSILKAYDDNAGNKDVSPEPKPENTPEPGIWEKFKKNHPKITECITGVGTVGLLAGIVGLAKIIAPTKKS